MKLSLVFELLLIFVLLAFAASRVIEPKNLTITKKVVKHKPTKTTASKNRQDVNKYCSCSTKLCNCCREFNIPVVSLQGPGCASLQYLQGDRLAISMSFGERVLTNTTVSGKKPKPVCMPLPGGVSRFCGRVYNIAREGEDFKACLGLELRALKDVEASLRVSCFRFGPTGLKTEPAQPLPVVSAPKPVVTKDDDDDEDDDDDDEYDEYDFDDDYENDVDSGDYSSFGVFDDDFVGNLFGGGNTEYIVEVEKPVKPTKPPPARRNTRKPIRPVTKAEAKPTKKVSPKPVKTKTTSKRKVSSTTVAPTTVVVTSTSKQEIPNVTPNTISSIKSNIETSSETIPSPSHESIAVVTAMLQNFPGETSQVPSVNVKPVKGNTNPASDESSNQSTLIPNNVSTNSLTLKPIASSTVTEISQKVEATTSVEKVNTESYVGTTEDDDDDDEESTETVENYILKNDSLKDDDDDEDDDDDDEDSDEDDIDSLTDPISSVVEEVLGDEKKNVTKSKPETKKVVKSGNNKTSENVLDDIVDGVVETISSAVPTIGTTAKKSKKTNKVNKVKKPTEDDDDDDDDDDDEDDSFDDSDESNEDDDDDDDDDEDEARKINVPLKYSSRRSKDMRLFK